MPNTPPIHLFSEKEPYDPNKLSHSQMQMLKNSGFTASSPRCAPISSLDNPELAKQIDELMSNNRNLIDVTKGKFPLDDRKLLVVDIGNGAPAAAVIASKGKLLPMVSQELLDVLTPKQVTAVVAQQIEKTINKANQQEREEQANWRTVKSAGAGIVAGAVVLAGYSALDGAALRGDIDDIKSDHRYKSLGRDAQDLTNRLLSNQLINRREVLGSLGWIATSALTGTLVYNWMQGPEPRTQEDIKLNLDQAQLASANQAIGEFVQKNPPQPAIKRE